MLEKLKPGLTFGSDHLQVFSNFDLSLTRGSTLLKLTLMLYLSWHFWYFDVFFHADWLTKKIVARVNVRGAHTRSTLCVEVHLTNTPGTVDVLFTILVAAWLKSKVNVKKNKVENILLILMYTFLFSFFLFFSLKNRSWMWRIIYIYILIRLHWSQEY